MQTADVTVWLQALDGTWENCGADREVGVVPETLQLVADGWGSLTASFDLRRMPGAIWPDLASWAPVIVEIGGVPVWRGFTGETPTRDGADFVVNVQCKGTQSHLDDDVYRRLYVHTRLADWRDRRSHPSAPLGVGNYCAAGQVSSDNAITLMFPNGTALRANDKVGVIFDAGDDLPKRIVIQYESSNNNNGGAVWFEVLSASDPTGDGTLGLQWALTTAGAAGTTAVTPTGTDRYVIMRLRATADQTVSGDAWIKLKAISVFDDAAFESGNASALKASTVVGDALDRATLRLAADRSQIQATSFNIPDLAPERYVTPREQIEAVNAYHNWVTKIDLSDRMVFQARPTAPEVEIGNWPGSEFTDASANAGDEIYNRCVVTGNDGDGTPVAVERSAADQAGDLASPVSSPTPDNPSADSSTTGWSVTNATLSRDTVDFDSAPASIEAVGRGITSSLAGSFSGLFLAGVTYELRFALLSSASSLIPIVFGSGADVGRGSISPTRGVWNQVRVFWTPTANTSGAAVSFSIGVATVNVDTLGLFAAQPTLVDRRKFRRTKVLETSFAVSAAGGVQLSDTFLSAHRTTPLKGSVRITPGGCRMVLGGVSVHPSVLLTRTQELLRLAHRIDPDTGGQSRVGTIAQVTYTHRDQAAAVELDDPRRNFDALVSRLASVQGAG